MSLFNRYNLLIKVFEATVFDQSTFSSIFLAFKFTSSVNESIGYSSNFVFFSRFRSFILSLSSARGALSYEGSG